MPGIYYFIYDNKRYLLATLPEEEEEAEGGGGYVLLRLRWSRSRRAFEYGSAMYSTNSIIQ